jgi:AraC-like DNA-binding protein
MQINDQHYQVKAGGFLPRHQYITCHHSAGNQLFGIKFKVCPVLFQKDVDFSEYKERIFPLAYLIETGVIDAVKKASSFAARVKLVFEHYNDIIQEYESPPRYITIVTNTIKQCTANRRFETSVDELATQAEISKRTLQRYFEVTTGFSSKPALQTIKIRQALADLTEHPSQFHLANYGYYDYSHFSKHLRQFVSDKYLKTFQQFYSQRHSNLNE